MPHANVVVMDPVRVLLFVVVSLLTGLLIAVGIQAFLILLDLKRSIKKLNQLLEDAQILTNTIARPVAGLAHLAEGVKNIKSIIDFASNLANKSNAPKESSGNYSTVMEDEEAQLKERAALLLGQDAPHPVQKIQEQGRRFFHRSGKPLTS